MRSIMTCSLLVAVGLGGCADSSSAPGTAGWEPWGGQADSTSSGDTSGGWSTPDVPVQGTDAAVAKPDLPPEQEKEGEFGAPESSQNYVYIPATGDDRVVRVSGQTLSVRLIEVGDQPTVLKVVPGQDAAVVIDAGSHEVAIVRSTEKEDQVLFVPVLPNCNALAIDPKGQFAVVYYDHGRAKPGDPVGSFQALSVVLLQPGQEKALGISVGFRVRSVHFTPDGKVALVVTDDGVSVLKLTELQDGSIVAPVPVSKNPLDKPSEREVLTTVDATWAVVRSSGKTAVAAVHLPSKQIVEVELGSVPTDLDLLPDGSGALAVLRDTKEVALVPLPGQVTATLQAQFASMGELTAGLARVTDDGKSAVLYTSVAGIEQVAVLDLKGGVVQPVLLRKTVEDVLVVPGTRKAVLLHKPGAGPGGSDATEKFVDDSEGYTLFDLDSGFTKLVLTPVKPAEIGLSEDPRKAWFLLRDPGGVGHAVQEADLQTFQTKDHPLGSPPEHVRFLAKAKQVAVTQTHPSGRITFVHTQTGLAKTVTGFELNGGVK